VLAAGRKTAAGELLMENCCWGTVDGKLLLGNCRRRIADGEPPAGMA